MLSVVLSERNKYEALCCGAIVLTPSSEVPLLKVSGVQGSLSKVENIFFWCKGRASL